MLERILGCKFKDLPRNILKSQNLKEASLDAILTFAGSEIVRAGTEIYRRIADASWLKFFNVATSTHVAAGAGLSSYMYKNGEQKVQQHFYLLQRCLM